MADRHGVLLVDKPEGPTSHDMVAIARRLLDERRIGHAGTLDPLATGLLVLMVGKATRLARILSGVDKTYRGTVRLGLATETYDRAGEPLGPARPVRVDRETLAQRIGAYVGTVQQVPPVFSAKKVQGVPMYRLARRKKPLTPTPITVTFRRLDLLSFSGDMVEIEAEVSAGTYLRSFAHDLGEALGCGAHLHSLRRVAAGPFRVEEALGPDALVALGPQAHGRIVPMEQIPLGLPTLLLTTAGSHAVLHGRPCRPSEVVTPRLPLPPGRCRLQGPGGVLIGIGEVHLQTPSQGGVVIRPQIVLGG
jgi:tRNA pseudouridine55 synthase